jgi:hypothetical protein
MDYLHELEEFCFDGCGHQFTFGTPWPAYLTGTGKKLEDYLIYATYPPVVSPP